MATRCHCEIWKKEKKSLQNCVGPVIIVSIFFSQYQAGKQTKKANIVGV